MCPSDEEVFDTGASPDLRRSTRTSGRKRTSTGSAPYSRPKTKKKMSTQRSPVTKTPQTGTGPASAQEVPGGPQANPFASLSAGGQAATGNFMEQMQAMMGGMLGGMEGRLNKATDELRSSVTGQLDQALETIGSLDNRISETEKRLDSVESKLEKKIEESLRAHGLPACPSAVDEFPPLADEGSSFGTSGSLSYASALSRAPANVALSAGERRERDYWNCRKALRFRPVEDGGAEEAARKFMRDHLNLEESFLSTVGDLRAERVPFGPKTKYKKEVLVHFATVDARERLLELQEGTPI